MWCAGLLTGALLSHLLFSILIGVPLLGLVAMGGGFLLVSHALAPVVKIAQSAEQSAFSAWIKRVRATRAELDWDWRLLNRFAWHTAVKQVWKAAMATAADLRWNCHPPDYAKIDE
jgi:hypothetical protein